MSKASLEQWLQRLETIHPTEVELGLERARAVAQRLELLPVSQPVITVAGTNGKGSTVAVLEALLNEVGQSTGTYTSPHLIRFNERIRVAGSEVADAVIIEAFSAIDQARGEISLTYFEFATLAALWIFKAEGPDIIILEVGLGGRLDAVNIVDTSLAVITSIDLDHQGWLGHSRGEIAREKAGILRKATPVVVADPCPPQALLDNIAEVAAAPALFFGQEFTAERCGDQWQGMLRELNGSERRLEPLASGGLLPQNICAALQAVLLLGVDFTGEQLGSALSGLSVTGRRQLLQTGECELVLDVAHNPAAVNKLVEYLSLTPCNGRVISVFSAMSDKDIRGMAEAAAGHFDAWFLADQPHNNRAAKASDVAQVLRDVGQDMISISKNLRQAFRRAQSLAAPGDRVVVFGSFYTVADVLPLLQKDQNKHGVQ
jgi:dihydrofolate synthase/folylpolyglutamate synthase